MPKDLRSHSVNALQFTVRSTLLIFSIAVVALYASIMYLEKSYPRIAPYHPRKLIYICFPKEDATVAAYMSFLRYTDMVLSVLLIIPCVVLCVSNSFPKVHWPIGLICVFRFIIVLIEIVHVSSFNGDTQLDFILSVSEGPCKVDDSQIPAFNALVALFTLRCIKGYITINMATFAYGNSILICLFGLKSQRERRRVREHSEEHELEELTTHHHRLHVQFQLNT
uniref:G protein-coupled receptor n=1 Tax=Caenorhabditis tropicalis TaxID=1561998 RepID=A0A1I7TWH4_9PELO